MNRKRLRRKSSWRSMKYSLGICVEMPRESKRTSPPPLCVVGAPAEWHSSLTTPKYTFRHVIAWAKLLGRARRKKAHSVVSPVGANIFHSSGVYVYIRSMYVYVVQEAQPIPETSSVPYILVCYWTWRLAAFTAWSATSPPIGDAPNWHSGNTRFKFRKEHWLS
jgi:hypothetical protein